MKKITKKILSIPPYISTSWKNIDIIHVKQVAGESALTIALYNGTSIDIPGLEESVIKEVFETHAKYLEQEAKESQGDSLKGYEAPKESKTAFSFGFPFPASGGGTSLNPNALFEHNPSQANASEMPPEVIEKITSITKSLGMDIEQMDLPKAEPHCNCPYCQIARAMRTSGENKREEELEEEVSEEDLTFRDWDIEQEGENLYLVSNPLNKEEHYQVYLGTPIGCTCGKKKCEHVRTVLNS